MSEELNGHPNSNQYVSKYEFELPCAIRVLCCVILLKGYCYYTEHTQLNVHVRSWWCRVVGVVGGGVVSKNEVYITAIDSRL